MADEVVAGQGSLVYGTGRRDTSAMRSPGDMRRSWPTGPLPAQPAAKAAPLSCSDVLLKEVVRT